MRNFLLEREGRLVVLGEGGERRIWLLLRKVEENRGCVVVVEAMDGFFQFCSLSLSLVSIFIVVTGEGKMQSWNVYRRWEWGKDFGRR